jgi:hypothetical protein
MIEKYKKMVYRFDKKRNYQTILHITQRNVLKFKIVSQKEGTPIFEAVTSLL